ncbi:hypothetical protein [Helicobacter felis]|uniref:hypothetical protein n=1 Tax=Helicobacter felis TaxID=214 RepID=UPI001F256503|nr:hypothetical protein [Helicobacter felis]
MLVLYYNLPSFHIDKGTCVMLGSATSNQQPASGCVALTPSEFHFSKTLLTGVFALLALTPLSAENNGAFIQGGVNYYSNFSGTVTSVVKSASVQDLIDATEQNLIEELVKDGDTPARAKELAQIGLPAMAKAIESKYPNGIPSSTTTTHYNGNLYGGNIEVGYKQFFGKKSVLACATMACLAGKRGIIIMPMSKQANKLVRTNHTTSLLPIFSMA